MIIFSYYTIGIIALIACQFVVSSFNPVNKQVSLIITYQAGSFLYAIMDFYFISLTYIIVYVGAIAILFLFVIMMIPTHVDYTKPQTNSLTISLATMSFIIFIQGIQIYNSTNTQDTGIITYFYPSWATSYITFSDIYTLGNIIYLAYPLALILIGQALWVTQIGVIPQTSQ